MDPGQLFIDAADVVRCELLCVVVFLTAQCIDVECYCGWRIGLSELREALVVESFFLVLLLCMLLSFFFCPSQTLLTHVLRHSPPALRLIRATDEKKQNKNGCVLRMDPSILDRMCGYHVVLCALTHRTMHGSRLACCTGGVKPCAVSVIRVEMCVGFFSAFGMWSAAKTQHRYHYLRHLVLHGLVLHQQVYFLFVRLPDCAGSILESVEILHAVQFGFAFCLSPNPRMSFAPTSSLSSPLRSLSMKWSMKDASCPSGPFAVVLLLCMSA